jgi:HAD superfamily hydrolase (TIGR01509 family)
MIKAVIFDLDGTLVQTESLKAISYARAAIELSGNRLSEKQVIEAFKEVVGLSRREVAQSLMNRLGLQEAAGAHMAEFEVQAPWQAFVQIRLAAYNEMLTDPQILREHECPYNVGLLKYARANAYRTGLATMSFCTQVGNVLKILGLERHFDFIASRDDVEHGKPDPEMYLLVSSQLNVSPSECLVIEDSPSGVKAALAAGMRCIVVTTDFTRKAIHEGSILPQRWIVDDPSELQAVANEVLSLNCA